MKSNEPHETMPIAAFGQKQRPSRFFMTPPRLQYTPSLQSPITVSDKVENLLQLLTCWI